MRLTPHSKAPPSVLRGLPRARGASTFNETREVGMSVIERILTMADGRAVGVADYGAAGDMPVIWCHGGPGCRLEPACSAEAASRAGLRLVGIDRPGYGRSTPQPGRTIGGW